MRKEDNASKINLTRLHEKDHAMPLWLPLELNASDPTTYEGVSVERPKQPLRQMPLYNEFFFKNYCHPDKTSRYLFKKKSLSQLVRRIFSKKVVVFFEQVYPKSGFLEKKMIQVSDDLLSLACAVVPLPQSLPMLHKEMTKIACYPENTFDAKKSVLNLSSPDTCKRYIEDLPVQHRIALCGSNLCDIIPPPDRNRAYEEGITQIEQICKDTNKTRSDIYPTGLPFIPTYKSVDSRQPVNTSGSMNICEPIDPNRWPRVSNKLMELETSCFDVVTFPHYYKDYTHKDSGFDRGRNAKVRCQSAVAAHLEKEGLGLCHNPEKEIPPPPSSHDIRYATGNARIKTVCNKFSGKHNREEKTAKDIDKTMQKIKIFNKLHELPSAGHELAVSPQHRKSSLLFHNEIAFGFVVNDTLRNLSSSKLGELDVKTTNTIHPLPQTLAIAFGTFIIGMGIGFWANKLKKYCSKDTPATYQVRKVAMADESISSTPLKVAYSR